MIVLDTNQLQPHLSLTSPTVAILRAIAHQSGERLAVPQIVADEFIAHYQHHVEELLSGIRRNINKLRDLDRASNLTLMGSSPIEAIVTQHRDLLEIIFEVLPLPEGAAETALRRELRREQPASTNWGKPGSGARDVALWLTAVAQMSEDQIVYFISNDEAAFGVGGNLHSDLAAELDGASGSFRYLNKIDDLLAIFATREATALAEFEWLTEDPLVRQALDEVRWTPPPTIIAGTYTSWSYQDMPLRPSVIYAGQIEQAVPYRLGNELWLSVRIMWLGQHQLWTGYANAIPGAPSSRTVVSYFRTPATMVIHLSPDDTVVAAQVVSIGTDELFHSEVIDG